MDTYINQIIELVTDKAETVQSLDRAIIEAHSKLETESGIFMNISQEDIERVKEFLCN